MDKERSALLVVDVQPDFMPGGALPVGGGDEIVSPVAELMEAELFGLIVAIQDWHPPEHVSFASNHPGRKAFEKIDLYGHEQILWPDHCVQGTPGADLHPGIPWARAAAIVRKATSAAVDSYSALRNNWDPKGNRPSTGLAGYLKDRATEEVFICGLARDFCVRWTAEDALQEGFRVNVIWDLCRSIEPQHDELLRRELAGHGVRIITAQELRHRGKTA
ncbi:MAG: bifunctional nicotinamidase/pyrazinamidase [Candidatus Binatus sp.]